MVVSAASSSSPAPARGALVATVVGSIGVVFGDIGTSPLYTLQVASEAQGGVPLDRSDIFGVISLIVWALIMAISVKYVGFVMRADNRGEGGILALLALLPKRMREHDTTIGGITILVACGAALLFGDGMITPAISVLSALEGLQLASPSFKPFIVPLTCGVLVALFAIQHRGTGNVGKLFGPIMALWFFTIGALGLEHVLRNPTILGALSPHWGVHYFIHHGLRGLAILGVVVLAITGGEALYADMGHFGRRPIRLSWFALVMPALILSYLGQGALVLRNPAAIANPFFSMVAPGPMTYALVILAAMATTIASQALISGVFSLTHQAVQLGLFPRVTVHHTSSESEGQIYVPLMNWGLLLACLGLVVGFRESARLASAYGIAVSGTMAITSIVFFDVTRRTWKWPLLTSTALLALFLSFDIPFFAANLLKFVDGGYIPILVGLLFFIVMLNWKKGRQILRQRLEERTVPLPIFVQDLNANAVQRIPGIAVYLAATSGVPLALRLQTERVRSLAEHVVLVTVAVEHDARVDESGRYETKNLAHGFLSVLIRFGYMEKPEIPLVLARAVASANLPLHLADATYYVGRETFLAGPGGKMKPLAEGLFAFLTRNAVSATSHFGLPAERVVELGTQIDL